MLNSRQDFSSIFQLLFEATPHPYLVLGCHPTFPIIAVNDRYLAATGTQRDAIIGRGLFDVFPDNPEDKTVSGVSDLRRSLQRVMQDGAQDVMGVQKYDIPQVGKLEAGFETRYWSPVNSPVFDENGRVVYIVHHVEDITDFIRSREAETDEHASQIRKVEAHAERMEAEVMRRATDVKEANRKLKITMEDLERRESELAELNARLREADRAKTEFFSNVSHEFRTPLTLLLGPIEELLERADIASMDAPRQRRLLDIAHRNALRLLKLVNTLLDFSRIEAKRTKPQLRAVDLSRYTIGLASNFRSLCERSGLQLIVDCPLQAQPVEIDTDMWEKIVLNLLSNAFKFTFKGSITVRLRAAEKWIELVISDTGTGIPPKEIPHLFERFHRINGAHGRSYEGSGIGLALVRELARLHGGEVTAESAEGIGSSFTVRIPRIAAPCEDHVTASPSDSLATVFVLEASQWLPDASESSGASSRIQADTHGSIVVVDDNSDMRAYVRAMLLAEGYTVTTFDNARAALAHCRETLPDLVLSDIMMPDMDGLTFLAQIRGDPRISSLPVILLSARAGEEARIKGLASGADDYLVKPFAASELIARVESVIRMAAVRRDAELAMRKLAGEVEDLYDHAPCGYHSIDATGLIVRMNRTELQWLGYDAHEVVGIRNFAELLSPASRACFEGDLRSLLKEGLFHDKEYELVRRDGSLLPVLASANVVRAADGLPLTARMTVCDYAERRRVAEDLRQAAIVFSSTNEAIVVAAPDRRILMVNQAFSRISGFQPEEVIGRTPSMWQSGRHDDAFYSDIMSQLESTGQWQGEIWNRRKNGEFYPAWENISAVRDEQGRISHYVAIFSDISAVKAAEEKIVHMAHHDPLTALPNRLLFASDIDLAMARARRHGKKMAVFLLDLDRFKTVNDTLGHAVGDELLRIVAGRLRQCVRADDTVARLGGDEFAFIVNDLGNAEDAVPLATKIIHAVADPLSLAGKDIVTSTSIGVSLYPSDAGNAEDLVKAADAAMYRAKARGRNTYQFYSVEMQAEAMSNLAIETDLRRALSRGEFELHYQPQVALASGEIVGVEALLRWQHPTRGVVFPNEFISIAEECGLIEAVGKWVLDAALSQASRWSEQGIGSLRVAVNISGRQIMHDHVVGMFNTTLAKYPPLAPGITLEVEITESVLLSYERCADTFRRLKEHGLSIAIDDFGTGFSSLSRLKHLAVDTLKIDRAFIRNLPYATDDQAITTAIIAMAHSLGLNVIAEGVESKEQMAFLQRQRCDEIQGFAVSEAINAAAMTGLLMRRTKMQPGLRLF